MNIYHKSKKDSSVCRLIAKFLPGCMNENVVISFGDFLYADHRPSLNLILEHEVIHMSRQKNSKFWAIFWWIKYIRNKKFRYAEELMAYRNQFKRIKERVKDRNERARILYALARDLSGDIYGNLKPFSEVVEEIGR